jgi:acyl-coenzyme A thioesterase PaaI-like protein
LAGALIGHQADPESLAEIAATARALTIRVQAQPVRDRAGIIRQLEAELPDGHVPMVDDRPMCGPANPTAVPMFVRRDGDEAVIADVVIDVMFQGGVGRVHGGILAGLLDDICGHLTTILRLPAVTGKLTTTYRRMTPVGVPLEVRAWVAERRGRRVHIAAEIRDGDTVTVTAEALYVVVERERYVSISETPAQPPPQTGASRSWPARGRASRS